MLKARQPSTLTALNGQGGKGFGSNGKTFFKRTVTQQTGRYTGWTPAEACPYYDNPHVPIMIENIPLPLGLIVPLPDLKSHFQVGLAATTYKGSYDYDADSDQLVLNWDENGLDESIAAARHLSGLVDTANPGSYVDEVVRKMTSIPWVSDAAEMHHCSGQGIRIS